MKRRVTEASRGERSTANSASGSPLTQLKRLDIYSRCGRVHSCVRSVFVQPMRRCPRAPPHPAQPCSTKPAPSLVFHTKPMRTAP